MAKRQKKEQTDPRAATAIDRAIGARVRARRLELGKSQERLGEDIGVTFQQIQKYEKGINRISAATLVHISEALDVGITALLPSLRKPGAAEKTSVDDLDAQAVAVMFARLNADGQRVLTGIARFLMDDDKMRRD